MSLIPTHLMNNSVKSLSLISARQEALADNIANMHTPGYRRKDVDFSQYLSTTPSTNLEAKMVDKYGSAPISTTSTEDKISVEDELSKMQENYLYYAAASRQLSSTISQIRTVLNIQAS